MSEHPTVTTVFEEVEPDPDAVLEEFGVDSPDDLAGDGRHDPIPDESLAADETFATDLFDARAEVSSGSTGESAETSSGSTGEPDEMSSGSTDETAETPSGKPDADTDLGDEPDRESSEVVLSEPSVTVLRGDGADIDELVGRHESPPERPRREPTLVGPGPSITRVVSGAFGE